MTKKLTITKISFLTIFSLSYILGFFISPFLITKPNKEKVYVSVFDDLFIEKFPNVRALFLVLLVVCFILLVMLVICIIGEFSEDKEKKWLKVFGYHLADKDIRQVSYILVGLLLASFLVHGSTLDGNTLNEYKLSCLTPTFYFLMVLAIIMLIVTHIGSWHKKKTTGEDKDYLNLKKSSNIKKY